jgi:hypothetical protein
MRDNARARVPACAQNSGIRAPRGEADNLTSATGATSALRSLRHAIVTSGRCSANLAWPGHPLTGHVALWVVFAGHGGKTAVTV